MTKLCAIGEHHRCGDAPDDFPCDCECHAREEAVSSATETNRRRIAQLEEQLTTAKKSGYDERQSEIDAFAEKMRGSISQLEDMAAKREAANAALTNDRQRLFRLLKELHTIVWGECPSLLNEDSGGDAALDFEICEALKGNPPKPRAITITERSHDFHACVKDHLETWDCGPTPYAAVGNLILSYPDKFGVAIEQPTQQTGGTPPQNP